MPVHVTLRARSDAPSLRSDLVSAIALEVFAELGIHARDLPRHPGCRRRHRRATDDDAARFHVAHWSLQRDHVHLIVEATDKAALSAGVRRLVIRLAKRINEVVRRTHVGKVWAERYHRHDLASPSELRRALVYVLQNGRKHRTVPPLTLDPFSSGLFFQGWSDVGGPRVRTLLAGGVDPFAPRTWLLAIGWQRAGGRIALAEEPRPPSHAPPSQGLSPRSLPAPS